MRGWITLLVILGGAGVARADALPAFADRLEAVALERTRHRVVYDGAYVAIAYPMGDVAPDRGVCTDVIIRAYRALGVDLQRLVHEDMTADFAAYPALWGLSRPDRNIDHRRVPNLAAFFTRHGQRLAVTADPSDYLPGDLVTWTVGGNRPHIGIVTRERSADGVRPLIVHNIGRGPLIEDMLFEFPITGHYRYHPQAATRARP
ncbi:MAG: DUF1287 domain-containing protein [Rhodospirillaceae bacterium]|nr:DUF1287 domain-containing protein [Rhodospirillaceae bacterium]